MENDDGTFHPEELKNAEKENRPVLMSQLYRYDHLKHTIPLGSLVRVQIDEKDEDCHGMKFSLSGECTLYVVAHTRDCDGTPLYSLSTIPVVFNTGGSMWAKEKLLYSKIAEYHSHHHNQTDLTPTGKVVPLASSMNEWLFI